MSTASAIIKANGTEFKIEDLRISVEDKFSIYMGRGVNGYGSADILQGLKNAALSLMGCIKEDIILLECSDVVALRYLSACYFSLSSNSFENYSGVTKVTGNTFLEEKHYSYSRTIEIKEGGRQVETVFDIWEMRKEYEVNRLRVFTGIGHYPAAFRELTTEKIVKKILTEGITSSSNLL